MTKREGTEGRCVPDNGTVAPAEEQMGGECFCCKGTLFSKTPIQYLNGTSAFVAVGDTLLRAPSRRAWLCPLCAAFVTRCETCRWYQEIDGGSGMCFLDRPPIGVVQVGMCRQWEQRYEFLASDLKQRLRNWPGNPRPVAERDVTYKSDPSKLPIEICASPGCGRAFPKRSTHHRYCSHKCRRRDEMRAYRARRKES